MTYLKSIILLYKLSSKGPSSGQSKKPQSLLKSPSLSSLFFILQKQMGSVKQHKKGKNFRSKNEIEKAHSFFMSARPSDVAVVKSVSYADKHHTHIYN